MLKNKITAVVLERSGSKLQKIISILAEVPEIFITGKATTVEQGYSLICSHLPIMVFVNFELSDSSGLELVQRLHNRNIFPEIIFTASESHLAFETLPLKPFDFFTEPVKKKDVVDMLERYKLKLKKNTLNNKIDSLAKKFNHNSKRTFRYKNGIIVLQLDEVIICQSNRSKAVLILKDGEQIVLSMGIKETIQTINHDNFVKCSRSYWINRNYLRKIDKRRKKCIIHSEGKSWEVPVSRDSMNYFEALITYPVS